MKRFQGTVLQKHLSKTSGYAIILDIINALTADLCQNI